MDSELKVTSHGALMDSRLKVTPSHSALMDSKRKVTSSHGVIKFSAPQGTYVTSSELKVTHSHGALMDSERKVASTRGALIVSELKVTSLPAWSTTPCRKRPSLRTRC